MLLQELPTEITESAGSYLSVPQSRLAVAGKGNYTLRPEALMIYWALMFLLVAVIAAVFGFTGVAVAAAGIAKLLFFVFLVLFVVTFASHLTGRGRTRI
jgi:uncharacterized membrane protein YtjA (UPF0391 family)